MLLNLYYIISKGSSELVTNGWKEKYVKESEFLAPLCLPGFLGLLLTIFTIFLFFFLKYILSEFWSVHKGQPHYIGFGWAIHWHRGMTAIQEGKFGHKSILWPVWTRKLPRKPGISNFLSCFCLPPAGLGDLPQCENSFHSGSQLGQLCLILSASGVKKKISREYHSAYTS